MSTQSEAAELKTQGAVEAAQDPNSSVTAADAERKIIAESKKAGVAAFTFDPDATPEQKAAQARAVSYSIRIFVRFHTNSLFSAACAREFPPRTQVKRSFGSN
jgi:hypothetical protein